MFQNIKLVHVYFMRESYKCLMGRLFLKDRKIFFEYENEFIKTGLELSPFKLPLKPNVTYPQDFVFEGLFGVFNDSLPDGWGRRLLDRKLMNLGINPSNLSPLDRLCFVGSSGMGALIYEPENPKAHGLLHGDLDEIAHEIKQFQNNIGDNFVDELLSLSDSAGGARPKIMARADGVDWVIKFRSIFDLEDIGNIEYAYNLMAAGAGLDVPTAKLFPSKKGGGYFGVQRFDHVDGKRIHMHTVSGLLHADHRHLNLDYETIMKATLWLTRDVLMCKKQFRAAVFNVLSHNQDDHGKNFSFLMDEKGAWSVSPPYDLTFSTGPSGEHCTMVMGEGKNPTLSHLLKLAGIGNLKKEEAFEIIDEVESSISKWHIFADEANVSHTSRKIVQKALKRYKS